MVKGADAKAEFVRDVDHVRHLVGAIAMILDQNLASQHPSERFELQVALRRIARAVALLPSVPFARIIGRVDPRLAIARDIDHARRSEEHTSELQSIMRISYAVFC